MNDLEFLQGIRGILSEPSRWTQGRVARNKTGKPVAWNGPEATCWCMLGAAQIVIDKVSPSREYPSVSLARLLELDDVVDPERPTGYGDRRPILFNDDEKTTFEDVTRKLDEAIQRESMKQVAAEAQIEYVAAEPEEE